jgi:ABC-type molybdate transport system ATPase subunit
MMINNTLYFEGKTKVNLLSHKRKIGYTSGKCTFPAYECEAKYRIRDQRSEFLNKANRVNEMLSLAEIKELEFSSPYELSQVTKSKKWRFQDLLLPIQMFRS